MTGTAQNGFWSSGRTRTSAACIGRRYSASGSPELRRAPLRTIHLTRFILPMCTGTPGWNRWHSSISASPRPGMMLIPLSQSPRPASTAAKARAPSSTRTLRARPCGVPAASDAALRSRSSRWRVTIGGSMGLLWCRSHCSWNSSSHNSCSEPCGCLHACKSSLATGVSTCSRSGGPISTRARPAGESAAAVSSCSAQRAPESVAHGSCRCSVSRLQSARANRSAAGSCSGSRAERNARSNSAQVPKMEPAMHRPVALLLSAALRSRRRCSIASSGQPCARGRGAMRLSIRSMMGIGGIV
mmetsp:Transcript_48279/g.124597  ORF Transcript_48279/g.124597 Transcript_48279/m.124597 type:complete len:300 (-) Transcript_48279:1227-2126(-)